MSIDINTTIEEIVRDKQISYMEAIIMYADNVDYEIEMVAKFLNKSIKDKVEAEADELNMMKKKCSKLPL
tara:strand:- start:289 stop:498 length:210 start_codon:yes stop_codon:yes gene_type:complete